MTPRVIGLTGLAGAGKSTVARLLGTSYYPMRFAGPLKDMLRAIGLGDDEIEGHRKGEPCDLLAGRTPRFAMQTLGQEWGRDLIHPDLWVRIWSARVEAWFQAGGGAIVAEDCRYLNEAAAIRAFGGEIWRIERPGQTAGAHVSEAGQAAIEPDRVIVNDGDFNQLRDRVAELLRSET